MTQFAIRGLSVGFYCQEFTFWHYRVTGGAISDLLAPGFFAPAGDMLSAGDMIAATASDGGALLFVREAGASPVVTLMVATAPVGPVEARGHTADEAAAHPTAKLAAAPDASADGR